MPHAIKLNDFVVTGLQLLAMELHGKSTIYNLNQN